MTTTPNDKHDSSKCINFDCAICHSNDKPMQDLESAARQYANESPRNESTDFKAGAEWRLQWVLELLRGELRYSGRPAYELADLIENKSKEK